MEGWSFALLGMIIGMQHAFEADHLAAIATLFRDDTSRWSVIFRGVAWGAGHSFALFAICGVVILLGIEMSPQLEAALELGVGLMVVFLGLNLLRTIKRRRFHVHGHRHEGGEHHIHVHSHELGEGHDIHVPHAQVSAQTLTGMFKPFGIGMAQGAAGSGALLLVMALTANSYSSALLYVLLFGAGSILGMAALSLIISYPLGIFGKKSDKLQGFGLASVGAFAIFIGGNLIFSSWMTLS